jgi:type I restriction enzyme S subunit
MVGEYDVQPLGTVAKVRSGYAFKSEDMGAVGLPIIKIKNIMPPTVDITDCERVPEAVISSIPQVDRFELKEGDTLIAMTGATVGKVGKFPRTHERHFLNQRVGKVYLTAPNAADYRYIYYILSQDTYVRQMFGIADGSAQANISGSQIESLEVALPPLPSSAPSRRCLVHWTTRSS